ncbi:hypothetical protein [Spirosoma koreense]
MKYFCFGLLTLTLLACDTADRKISVTDSDDTYTFFARYDPDKDQEVKEYINRKMASTTVTGEQVDVTTRLDDNTEFKLEEWPGEVRISLDKRANSDASYRRIKAMCEGVKNVVADE